MRIPSSHPLLRPLLLLAALLLLGAGGNEKTGTDDADDFWGEVVEPGRRQFRREMERGRAYLRAAAELERGARTEAGGGQGPYLTALESAAGAFRQAIGHSPSRGEGHYWLGKALYIRSQQTGRGGGSHHDTATMRQAVQSLLEARRLERDLSVELRYDLCFSLGIGYSVLEQFQAAVQEYDRAERLLGSLPLDTRRREDRRLLLNGNAAECLMAQGRLEEAILRYGEAMELAPRYPPAAWGLAVAYDRDEQLSRSADLLRILVARDPAMSAFTEDGVFFVPDGEVHYYQALGYQALGNLEQARGHFRLFLEKLPGSQWAPRVRAHLAQLEGPQGAVKTGKQRQAPIPGVSGVDPEAEDRSRCRTKMRSYVAHARRCYEGVLRKKGDLMGKVQVSFEVGSRGKAGRIRVTNSTMGSPSMERCVMDVIKSINFLAPLSHKPIRVKYTFSFKPLR